MVSQCPSLGSKLDGRQVCLFDSDHWRLVLDSGVSSQVGWPPLVVDTSDRSNICETIIFDSFLFWSFRKDIFHFEFF